VHDKINQDACDRHQLPGHKEQYAGRQCALSEIQKNRTPHAKHMASCFSRIHTANYVPITILCVSTQLVGTLKTDRCTLADQHPTFNAMRAVNLSVLLLGLSLIAAPAGEMCTIKLLTWPCQPSAVAAWGAGKCALAGQQPFAAAQAQPQTPSRARAQCLHPWGSLTSSDTRPAARSQPAHWQRHRRPLVSGAAAPPHPPHHHHHHPKCLLTTTSSCQPLMQLPRPMATWETCWPPTLGCPSCRQH
jgi:hypothetical protein